MGRIKGNIKKTFDITVGNQGYVFTYHTTKNRSLVITDPVSGKHMRIIRIDERRRCKEYGSDKAICLAHVRGMVHDKTPAGFRAWINELRTEK